jgi:feruloyl esterase
MTHTRILAGTATAAVALALAAPAQAACGDLAGLTVPDGSVTSAEVVAAGAFQPPAGSGPPPGVTASPFADVPAFCRIRLTLTPSSDSDIKSEVWLPLEGWNGKYAGVGNGIWAGSISFAELGRNVARSYATAATDTGHTGNGLTAEWAVGHPEKLVDFGHRAVHVTTVAAKRVTEAFYG